MKKLLIILFLFVGLIFMKPLNTKIKEITYNYSLDFCKEHCEDENGNIPCGNCLPECMGEW